MFSFRHVKRALGVGVVAGLAALGTYPVATPASADQAAPTQQPARYQLQNQRAVLPLPAHLNYQRGKQNFVFAPNTCVTTDAALRPAVQIVRQALQKSQGLALPEGASCPLRFMRVKQVNVGGKQNEAYALSADSKGVLIKATSARGAIWGAQTLLQLIGPWATSPVRIAQPAVVPAVFVADAPHYSWRGMLVMPADAFLPIPRLKQLVDAMSAVKMNVLHMHFADDNAWRLALTSVPGHNLRLEQLTHSAKDGHFYTRDQFVDLVKYAAQHGVSVLPEIDGPGHAAEMINALPQLKTQHSVPGFGPTPNGPKWTSLDTGAPQTYEFLGLAMDQIVKMVNEGVAASGVPDAALPYFHVGGDEAKNTPAEGYKQYLEKLAKMARDHRTTPVMWNEAMFLQDRLPAGTAIQWWDSAPDKAKLTRMVNEKKIQVLYSHAPHTYLSQTPEPGIKGPHWACPQLKACGIHKFYEYNVQRELGVPDSHILGVEAALWTGSGPKWGMDPVGQQYMTFPRLFGTAEVGWSAPARPDFSQFAKRLSVLGVNLMTRNFSFHLAPEVRWFGSAQGVPVPAAQRGHDALVGLVAQPGVSSLDRFPRAGVLRDAAGHQYPVPLRYEMPQAYNKQDPNSFQYRRMNSLIKVYARIPAGVATGLARVEGVTTVPPTQRVAPAAIAFKVPIGNVDATQLLRGTAALQVSHPARPAAGPFRDVAPSSPFSGEIAWAKGAHITTGWADGGFRPYATTDRNAMAAFLYRLCGSPSVNTSQQLFTDVRPGDPFYKEITWLASTGVTRGWPDGTFRPYSKISREAMAAFIYRLVRTPEFKAAHPDAHIGTLNVPADLWANFADTATTPFGHEIAWLQQTGITTGWPDNTFRPLLPIERNATIAFVYRLLSNR